jgi:hypothetical protein
MFSQQGGLHVGFSSHLIIHSPFGTGVGDKVEQAMIINKQLICIKIKLFLNLPFVANNVTCNFNSSGDGTGVLAIPPPISAL